MYNYYTDLKRKEKLNEEKKELEKEKQIQKKREKKMKEYSKNYENRIKNFIYSMAEKPIQLRESKKPFLTTREELLFEESNKILYHKGFVFNLYQTDRERLNNYINQNEREVSDYTFYNNNHIKLKSNSFDIHNYSNENLSNKTNSSFRKTHLKLKSKNDLEKTDRFIKTKLLRNKNQKDYSNENNPQQKSIDELFEELRNRDEGKKGIKKRLDSNFISLKKNPNNSINSNDKNLNMYNKTYFNAVENYSLFKDSCFLPKKFRNKIIENETNNNFPNTNFNFNKKKKYRIANIYENYMQNNNIPLTDSNIKNEINFSSPNELIDILNNSKSNSKEETLLKSLNNIDLFVQGIKEKKPTFTKTEQFNFDVIKHLAFDNTKKKNFPIIDINKKSNSHKEDNNNIDLSNNSNLNEENEDYNMRKQVEIIKVNGIDYNKNDLENLSKAIMDSCKVTRHKFRKEDSKYSHNGNGKLMFTNGLTLKEFEKKYHIKP